MFSIHQNQKISRWRVNRSFRVNISTTTYGRGAGPTMTEYDLSEVAPDFPQKDISINIGIFWTFSTSDLTQVNLQIASRIHVLHPSKPKNFTLTRELSLRSPGKYEHRDLWEEAGPFRNCFWFSPKGYDIAINIWDFLNIFHRSSDPS